MGSGSIVAAATKIDCAMASTADTQVEKKVSEPTVLPGQVLECDEKGQGIRRNKLTRHTLDTGVFHRQETCSTAAPSDVDGRIASDGGADSHDIGSISDDAESVYDAVDAEELGFFDEPIGREEQCEDAADWNVLELPGVVNLSPHRIKKPWAPCGATAGYSRAYTKPDELSEALDILDKIPDAPAEKQQPAPMTPQMSATDDCPATRKLFLPPRWTSLHTATLSPKSPCRRGRHTARGAGDAVMSPKTPKSVASARSVHTVTSIHTVASESWDEESETLIILDWDDTLCPSTACRQLIGKPLTCEIEEKLAQHQSAVSEFLKQASTLGKVVIVTMAEQHWVNSTMSSLLPDLAKVLLKLEIDVVSARESRRQRLWRQAFSDDRDPSQFFKTKAMEKVIKQFHKTPSRFGSRKSRSWKNIISIGDSVAERLALQDLVFRKSQRSRHGEWKECRCKTLLLIENPDLQQMTAQMHKMFKILSVLVKHDGDIHVDMEDTDLEIAA
jgi:hypothetical protein